MLHHMSTFSKIGAHQHRNFPSYLMANQTTPESEKTVSKNIDEVPSLGLDEPTPKTDKKALVDQQRHVFMSPTDAMTSPCTQKLINLHRYPRRQTRPTSASTLAGTTTRPISKLTNKENELGRTNEEKGSIPVSSGPTPSVDTYQ